MEGIGGNIINVAERISILVLLICFLNLLQCFELYPELLYLLGKHSTIILYYQP